MAQPTPYTRQANFTDFQSVNPDEPLPASQVDAEFDAVKLNLDGLNQNLGAIQRDDGQLANQSVHPESVSNATLSMLNSDLVQRGAWVTLTAYAVNDLVTESSNVYLCLVAHTSGTFATDLSAAKWALLTRQGIAPDGSTTVTANIPMGTFKFTGLGNGSARTDSINLGQAQDMSIQWAAVSGTADAIVLTLTPAVTVYVSGQTIKFKATATNTTATTVNWGGGVIAIRYNNAALAGGEIVNGRTYELTYDGAVAQLSNYHEATIPIAAGGTGQITAALAFAALKQAATDSDTGAVEKATAAEVAAGTADKYPDAALIPAAPYIGRRNKLINGGFDVWQRGAGGAASFATPANGAYTADRWAVEYDGTIGTFSVIEYAPSQAERALLQALSGSAPRRALQWGHTAAGSGQTLKKLRQRIENLKQFQSASIRVSFRAFVTSGTASVSLYTKYGYGTGGAPSSVEAGPTAGAFTVTTTRQKFEATLALGSFSGKTFGTDGDHTSYLELGFDLPLNTTFNVVIHDVQVEFGGVTTPFDRRQFGEELRDCQGYYFKTFPYATAPAQNAGLGGALVWPSIGVGAVASRSPPVVFPTSVRSSTTTATTYNPEVANAQVRNDTDNADCTSAAVDVQGQWSFAVNYTGTAGTAQNESMAVHVTVDAEL
jgi:hypothetical protein